ncbi:hypothetical protein [Methanoculleus thermophilus]|uniref:hypothetical protein n=1 Tax=Methanoculleus thermophilus TaxID=2200 RepID=UPI0008363F93|nr:hypothetical protein [Methanoculleus thermophilus]
MSRMIGFDRPLRLDWLDATAGVSRETEDIEQIRNYLHAYLAENYPNYTARRKTITVLTRVWSRIPESDRPHRVRAFALLPGLNQADRIWLHWGMCILAYPFFRDVVRTVGYSLRYYGSFSKQEIIQRMSETWGERATIPRAVQRVVESLNDWGVIRGEQMGRYGCAPPLTTSSKDAEIWLLKVALCANPTDSLPADQVHTLLEVFAFSFSLSIPDILESGEFEVSQIGNGRLALRCSEKKSRT